MESSQRSPDQTPQPFPFLPREWSRQDVALRPRAPGDLPFLNRLFRTTRWDEVKQAGLDRLTARRFLASQFALQCRHFDAHYQQGGCRLVVTARGEPIGRLELFPMEAEGRAFLHIVDISLLPEWRGRGLGSALVRAVMEQAAQQGRAVSLQVDAMSRAAALYQRLGFRQVADSGKKWRMESTAATTSPGEAPQLK